jgi:Fe2+ or Zn2+ uptake regulation protein
MKVTVETKLVAIATRYEPAEYDQRAICDECGKVMEIEDIPEGAEETEE